MLIQSASKPFTAALIMREQGPEVVREKIGVEPTGMALNSKLALAAYENSVNPLVNAGAIAAVSLVHANSEEERWNKVMQNISEFAGRPLTVLEKVYESEYSTAFGNRGIAHLLYNWERLYSEPEEALRVYTRQCSIGISTRALAVMGATLAMAGFYDESGIWMYTAARAPAPRGSMTAVPRLDSAIYGTPCGDAP